MPYIKKDRAKKLDENLKLAGFLIENCGELNYAFTRLLIEYIKTHKLSYQICNDIVGALDNAKDEFKRRIQADYEDLKASENGDYYEDIC